VALFDQTSFAKFVVRGRHAEALMQRLCANDMAVPVGRVVYTPMLNPRPLAFRTVRSILCSRALRFLSSLVTQVADTRPTVP